MKTQEEINNEIEKTLRVLDEIQPAEPRPFFYTRMKARMERTQAQMPLQVRWVLKPAVVFSTLGLIVALNVLTVINYAKHSTKNETSTEQTLEGFAKEYDLSNTN